MIGIPTRNSIRYLEERIDSIEAQTYSDYEILVVDGGSTDGTLERVSAWRDTNPRVNLFPTPIDGLYEAFNLVLEQCESEYVCILPSDDLMAHDFLEVMVAALDHEEHASVAVCPLRVFDLHTSLIESDFTEVGVAHDDSVHSWPVDGMHGLLRRNPYVSQTQLMMRYRDVVSHRFHCDLGSTADILFNLQIGFNLDVVHVTGTWAGWRVHETQASQTVSDQASKVACLERMISMAIDQHLEATTDSVYRTRFKRIERVCQAMEALRRSSGRTGSISRWVEVLRKGIRSPMVALLHVQDHFTQGMASERYLQAKAEGLRAYRIAQGLSSADLSGQSRPVCAQGSK